MLSMETEFVNEAIKVMTEKKQLREQSQLL